METEIQPKISTQTQRDLPPLIKRFQSALIDGVAIIICMVIFSQIFSLTDEESSGGLKGVLLFGLFFFYEPFCMAYGCTIGNFISGIRVRKFGEEEKRITITNSYLRFIVKFLLGIISFFTVTSDKNKRAMHDYAGGSIMVYAS